VEAAAAAASSNDTRELGILLLLLLLLPHFNVYGVAAPINNMSLATSIDHPIDRSSSGVIIPAATSELWPRASSCGLQILGRQCVKAGADPPKCHSCLLHVVS
jgi:hypothetical protein